MRLKIYLCGVYKTDRDMIGRKVIFLSYLFNMYASFCGVALLLCNGNIEEIWVEFVLDLLWTKILYKMLKHYLYFIASMSKILSADKICFKSLMMCKHTSIQRKMLMLFASVDQLMAIWIRKYIGNWSDKPRLYAFCVY